MGYPINYIGKYAKIDPNNLEPIGYCQRTQIAFNRKDLVKQMIQVGNKVVWDGLWVGRPFLDPPNPQNRIPEIKVDPEVVKDPCPQLPPVNLTQSQILAQLRRNSFNV